MGAAGSALETRFSKIPGPSGGGAADLREGGRMHFAEIEMEPQRRDRPCRDGGCPLLSRMPSDPPPDAPKESAYLLRLLLVLHWEGVAVLMLGLVLGGLAAGLAAGRVFDEVEPIAPWLFTGIRPSLHLWLVDLAKEDRGGKGPAIRAVGVAPAVAAGGQRRGRRFGKRAGAGSVHAGGGFFFPIRTRVTLDEGVTGDLVKDSLVSFVRMEDSSQSRQTPPAP